MSVFWNLYNLPDFNQEFQAKLEIQGRTSWLTSKLEKFKTKNQKGNQVAQKSARNEPKTGIPVLAHSRFRQEDIGLVCSLFTAVLKIVLDIVLYFVFDDTFVVL